MSEDARIVPAWAVLPDEAKLLEVPFPWFLRWAQTAEGRWWLERLRLKWRIEAAAREQEEGRAKDDAEDARWRAAGWRGGHTEPEGTAREG